MSEYFWRRMKNSEVSAVEKMLRDMEGGCVGVCSRFIARGDTNDPVWVLRGKKGGLFGLVINSRSTLMPVLCGKKEIPPLRFLGGFFKKKYIHSAQGQKEDVLVLQDALKKTGRKIIDIYDYDLMSIDSSPDQKSRSAGPANLILRLPKMTDLDSMAALQAAYEKEEVLPRGSVFSPAASRVNAANIIAKAQVLAAEIAGQLVGKINVSAVSFTRYQVGGVYVHPDFRGLGIARRMTAEFITSLVNQGRGVTLFVKKTNATARKLYTSLGFAAKGDYRITYY